MERKNVPGINVILTLFTLAIGSFTHSTIVFIIGALALFGYGTYLITQRSKLENITTHIVLAFVLGVVVLLFWYALSVLY